MSCGLGKPNQITQIVCNLIPDKMISFTEFRRLSTEEKNEEILRKSFTFLFKPFQHSQWMTEHK